MNELTKFGFKFGDAEVTRMTTARNDSVFIGLRTSKAVLSIYVTRTGKVRIFDDQNGEWKSPSELKKEK